MVPHFPSIGSDVKNVKIRENSEKILGDPGSPVGTLYNTFKGPRGPVGPLNKKY